MLGEDALVRRYSIVFGAILVFVSTVLNAIVMSELVAAETTVVVLLDDSGSMRNQMRTDSGVEPRMTVAKTALKRVVEQLPQQTTLGLLLMNGSRRDGGWLIPLAPLDRKSALAKIANVTADGGTPLGQSMRTAMDELLELRKNVPYGDYRLLVVTDGEATDRNVLDQYLPDMVARGITIDVIGVDMQSAHTLASRTHSYRRANDAASFEQALTEIFAESADSNADGGASNFDMIAGLPDAFATEALAALAKTRNGQIEDSETRPSVGGSQRFPPTPAPNSAAPAGSNFPVPSPIAPPPVAQDQGIGFGFLIAIVVFAIILFNGMTKKKRRRS
jgi:hypothetical protein